MESNTGSGTSTGTLRLVVFPFLAFGHLHPFLELSKLLASRGHRISFLSTPRNIQRLPRIPSRLTSLITFVPLPLPRVDPLPETAEATTDIPPEHVQYLEKAFDGLAKPFSAFLQSACSDERTKPDWVIMDAHHHWLPKIAKAFHVPCTFFCITPAASQVFYGPPSEEARASRTRTEHFTTPPSWIPFPSNLAHRPHEASWVVNGTKANASGIGIVRRVHTTIIESDFISYRTCAELESKWLSLLSELYKKDVVPVGLLPPNSADEDIDNEEECNNVIDWLGKHTAKSVLYIALGSEAGLPTELLHELAFGLEKSEVPFLWALRKPAGSSSEAIDLLPIGFEERVKGVGRVALGWVPQLSILAHPSVGGFLTHCGASSVIESMQFGHPLIMLPLIVDQGLIARVLDERGVGVELPRDDETGNFDRNDVAGAVRRVMVEEEGELIRRNAGRMQLIYTDKVSQEKHLDGFIRRLQSK